MDGENGFAHPECYAAGLRTCRGRVSREHYISRTVLKRINNGKTVLVRNHPPLSRDDEHEIGIESLTAKVLCKHHNNLLSPFDSTADKLFAAMESFTEASGKPEMPVQTIRIDGDAFERWMLKVFCGGMFSGNIRIPEFGSRVGEPPPTELLDILFGETAFRTHKGLYLVGGGPSNPFTTDRSLLKTSALHWSGLEVLVGVRVWMFGFEFDLVAMGVTFGFPLAMQDKDAVYRPAGISAACSNVRIQFDWREGPQSPEVVFNYLGESPASP